MNPNRPLFFALCMLLVTAADAGAVKPSPNILRKRVVSFDNDGYPEDRNGQLVWADSEYGRFTWLKERNRYSLLYYQFRNVQRDAVIMARLSDLTDNLPDGRGILIRRGYGAVKLNSVLLSGVKGEVKPHFGDNLKIYRHFTIKDWLLGFGFGATGPEAEIRFVSADTYVFYAHAAVNVFSGMEMTPLYGSFDLKVGFGVGARLPAPIQLPIIGRHYWGVYLDMAAGVGSENSFIPGILFEITKCTYGDRTKKRAGGLPYNYDVSEYFLRFGWHLDTRPSGSGGSFNVSLGYRFQLRGASIPGHDKKRTETVYLHPEYKKQKAAERGQ